MNTYIKNFQDEAAPTAVGYVLGDAAGSVVSGMIPGNMPTVVTDLVVFVGGNWVSSEFSGMGNKVGNGMAVAGAKGGLDWVVTNVSEFSSTNDLVGSIFNV